jgi:hypothetical protein
MTFFKNSVKTLLLTAILAVSAVYWSGCSGKKNPVTPPSAGSVVCEEGEAWIEDGKDVGYIFTSGNDLIGVEVSDGRWNGRKVGTYSTGDGKLTLVFLDSKGNVVEENTMKYSFSGDKLTLSGEGESVVFIKRTGVSVNV